MGKLIYRYGSMTSGKSLNLLNVEYNYKENGVDVLVLKPSIDTRGVGIINTRLSDALTTLCYPFSKDEDIYEKYKNLQKENGKDYKVVLIDETQFITSKQAEQISKIAYKDDLVVICYGLKVDFMGRPFEGSSTLIALASNIEEIKTICEECGKHKALFPLLYVKGELIRNSDTNTVIDNDNDVKYVQVCGKCYYKIIE